VERQHLIFDADDTLWENNVYFEDAFDQFCDDLSHSSLSPAEIRGVLDDIERTNSKIHGYGARNFARNLAECYQRLAERDISASDLRFIQDYARAILEHPIELIDGVEATIAELASRHELTLFTKGDAEEQRIKIDRSGLARYFQHAEIVREKHEPAYRQLADARGFDHARTWMIGNSPKSDINPALACGFSAVYVPHPRTWRLEHEDVPENHPRLLRVERISELTSHF
jgi:putative hydrolase of the HAD superfamily